MPQQCPGNATVSFPVGLGSFLLSYDTTPVTPLNLAINWGSTALDMPEFSQVASIQSGEIFHSSITRARLKYGDLEYSLQSVQITRPTHTKWLSLKERQVINNQEDLILSFSRTPIIGASQHIILVNPINRVTDPVVTSPFLIALANQTRTNINCETLFPNDTKGKYAYYITCTRGTTATDNYQLTTVIVNTRGLSVWNNFMDTIKSNFQRQHGQIPYPTYIPLFYQMYSEVPTSITTQANFNSLVNISNGYAAPGARPTIIENVTDSYKCVPFNPETDVSGGALYINQANGTPLKNALSQRQDAIDSYNASYTATIPYDILKQYTTTIIAIAFGVIGVVILIYFILWLGGGGESELGTGATQLKMWVASLFKVPIYVLIAFFCLLAGLLLGIGIAWKDGMPAPGSAPGPAGSASGPPASGPAASTRPQELLGGQVDSYGCIIAAGQTYCATTGVCLGPNVVCPPAPSPSR